MSDKILCSPSSKLQPPQKYVGFRGRTQLSVKGTMTSDPRFAGSTTLEATPVIRPGVPNDAPIEVRQICREELGSDEILVVKVRPRLDADPKNYVANIAREMKLEGGRPLFGWRLRTSAVWLAAEFYAMHETATGLVDVTPNACGENYVAFVPDYDVPADFNYFDRCPTRRFITYVPPTRQERVEIEMAEMEPSLLAIEQRRAAIKG